MPEIRLLAKLPLSPRRVSTGLTAATGRIVRSDVQHPVRFAPRRPSAEIAHLKNG